MAGRTIGAARVGIVSAVGALLVALLAGFVVTDPVDAQTDVRDPMVAPVEGSGQTAVTDFAVPEAGRGVPANPRPFTITQPDGTSFTAHRVGDASLNWIETDSGHAVIQADDGMWYYADGVGPDGGLEPSSVSASGDQAPPVGPGLHPDQEADDGGPALAPPIGTGSAAGSRPTQVSPDAGYQDEAPLVVILIEWNDVKSSTTPAQWTEKFFGSGSSVRDYFHAASYDTFDLTPATETSGSADGVVGWLDMGIDHPDVPNSEARPYMATALEKAGAYVDFASYDNNADGYISPDELLTTIIWAGYEASFGDETCGPGIWGHQWGLVEPPLVDGVYLGAFGYTAFGEMHCDLSVSPIGHMATIGVMVHEIGHEFGWPDLYNVLHTDLGGVGKWSVMGQGMWIGSPGGEDGDTPSLPDPFLRYMASWVKPVRVRSGERLALRDSARYPDVIQVLGRRRAVGWAKSSNSGIDEYFLIENRQQTGYDSGLPGCGILIWHIDERATFEPEANAYRGSRLVQLVQADGLAHLDTSIPAEANYGDAGDPFPGTSSNSSFDPTSTPSSSLNSGRSSGVNVSIDSASCAETMYLDVDAPPPGGITGTVTGSGGVPVAGAVVRVFDESMAVIASTSADTGGRYSFARLEPSGQYKIRVIPRGDERYGVTFNDGASSAASAPWITVSSGGDTTVDVALRQAFSIRGTVSDGIDPVSGAVVVLRGPDGAAPSLVRVRSDAGGGYAMVGLAPGLYTLFAKSPNGSSIVWYDGSATRGGASMIELVDPGSRRIDLVLPVDP